MKNPKHKITSVAREGQEVHLVIELATAREATDELVALAECGLEASAWRKLVRNGELPCRRIGRRWYTTKRALAALVGTGHPQVATLDPSDEPEGADEYQAALRQARVR